MWHRSEGGLSRILMGLAKRVELRDRQKRMRAMPALLQTGIAETPCALKTPVAVPVALIREAETGLAKRSLLQLRANLWRSSWAI